MTDFVADTEQDALADLFDLPAPYSEDARIVRWHREIVTRLQREAAGLPMSTAQVQLLERISFLYVSMRYREITNSTLSAREQKEFNTLWHSMLDTFNRSIEKHKDQILRDTVIKIQTIIHSVLDTVEDEKLRRRLLLAFAEELAAEGL